MIRSAELQEVISMSKDIVQIKGTRHGLVIMMDGSRDFNELKDNLKQKIESSKGFFNGAKFTFQIDNNLINSKVTQELQAYCSSHGLVYDPEIPFPGGPHEKKHQQPAIEQATTKKTTVENPTANCVQRQHPGNNSQITTQGLTSKELQQETLLVRHNLRSGQKIVYPGNVVILGDVNPGADIIAGGNIIIMGTLRGIAHAGASGDPSATITAYNLKPTQIRIAESLGRAPDDERFQQAISPEVAKIVNGQIVIEQLATPHAARKV